MEDEKYLFKKTKGDDGEAREYFFSDPQDFAEYSQLIRNGSASKLHHDEFYLRLIWHFIEHATSDTPPDKWVMKALADAFLKVVNGGRWEDEFPLPWTNVSLPWSTAEWSALSIYCDVANAVSANPHEKVTRIIKEVASNHSVSYEKARSAYYANKKRFSKISSKT